MLICSCVLNKQTVYSSPGYWPDPDHPNAVFVDRDYMEEVVDDVGRRWLVPGTASNFIYRAEHDGSGVTGFELDSYAVDIAAGAGSIWVIPSDIDPEDRVIWITPENTRSDTVYRIDPESGQVNGEILLPIPYGLVFLLAGEKYVWTYGRRQQAFFDFSHTFSATRIDVESLQVAGTYDLPNPLPLKDGREIRALIEPELLLVNEAGHLLLAYWPKGASQPGTRIILKFDWETEEYSDLGWPVRLEELCRQGEKVFLTRRGARFVAAEFSGAGCH